MNMTKLSVSSVILAAVLSGCSQQQVIGGSQVNGSQQQVEGAKSAVKASPMIKPRAAVKPAPVRVYNKSAVNNTQVRRVAAKPKMTRSIQRGNGLPAAKPGQCFAKAKVAPKYVTKSKRILIQKASSKRVLVRAPQYRWIAKKVLVRKAQYINRTIPAQYRNQTKRVLVRPAYNTWKKGHGAITRIDNATGQIMCRVTVPAAYKNVTKRVVVRPVQNVRKFIPAVYKTVKQKKRVSGALYKTVNRPARYKTQNYRVKVAGARYVWRPVLCATNAPKNYKHKSNYRKAAAMHKPLKRSHKQHYKRSGAATGGVSYAQYLAVMNAPLKSKHGRKTAPKRVIKKPMAPKVLSPKPETPKQEIPKQAAPEAIPKQEKVEAVKPVEEATPKVLPKVMPKTATMADDSATDATPKKKDSKAEIQKNIVYGIQAALKSKGYNPGKLDGKMGPKTATALKAFQSSRGLPVGVLSKDTFRALGLVK